jgi:hypothetical protein
MIYRLVFREMLEMPDPSKGSETRYHINLDESSQIVEDMLLAITRLPEAAAAFFSQRELDHLNSLLAVCDKYQIETHVYTIRNQVRKKWTTDQPLAALEQAVSWQDIPAIASVITRGDKWSDENIKSMAPWALKHEMHRSMGVDLYRSYTEAFFLNFRLPYTLPDKLLVNCDGDVTCEASWECDWAKVAEEMLAKEDYYKPSAVSSHDILFCTTAHTRFEQQPSKCSP